MTFIRRYSFLLPALLCLLAADAFATNTPTNLAASATSSSSIQLTWTDTSSDEIGFTFMFDTSSAFPAPTYVWTGGANVTSYAHTGRSAATTYFYRIKAEGTTDALDSPFGNTAAATTTPANLAATPVSSSQINLSWTGNAGNASITGYTVAMNTSASFTGASYQFVSGAGTTNLAKTGLSGSTTYYFAVKAEGTSDAYDSPFTSFVSATPTNAAPANLTATAVSSSQINLAWTPSGSGNVIGYTVATNTSASFSGASYQYVAGAGTSGLSKTGLASATTYYFAVKAEGTTDAYDSPFTAFASATTSGSQPPPSGQGISPYLFGENAWMPATIGSVSYGGHLDDHWGDIDASGVGIMRYGGIAVDRDADPRLQATLDQYVAMADHMRGIGAEPVLEVPFWHWTWSAQQAAAIVNYVNIVNHRGVKYWIVGNEPDYKYGYTSASQIAPYLRSYAAAMKEVDPSIKVIGPELASYSQTILDGLTDANDPDNDITAPVPNKPYFYVDVVTFHHYNGLDGNNVTSRDPVVNSLTQGSFNGNVSHLKTRLTACNTRWGRTGDNALQLGVTESNVNYDNAPGDNLYLYGAQSFLGGQWWAEFLGTAARDGVDMVTFWSVIEGNPQLGYLSHDGIKQPSYYHFKMMAENFRGAVADTTDNQLLVKTFASKASDQIAVVIINQEENAGFTYTVRLNTQAIAGGSNLKINVDAGLPIESTGPIAKQSTIILVFDASGTLKKKVNYPLFGRADAGLAPEVTLY
jgi:hypothetical protein